MIEMADDTNTIINDLYNLLNIDPNNNSIIYSLI